MITWILIWFEHNLVYISPKLNPLMNWKTTHQNPFNMYRSQCALTEFRCCKIPKSSVFKNILIAYFERIWYYKLVKACYFGPQRWLLNETFISQQNPGDAAGRVWLVILHNTKILSLRKWHLYIRFWQCLELHIWTIMNYPIWKKYLLKETLNQ